MGKRGGFIVLLTGLCLSVLAGCSDDDGGADATTTTETEGDATTTTSIFSDDTVIEDDDGGDEEGATGGDEEFCDTLSELDRVNDETSAELEGISDWTEAQALIAEASADVEELYTAAAETAPPELEQAFEDLVAFASLQAEIAEDATSEEDFSDALQNSPEFLAGTEAVQAIDEYSQESCGFTILQS